MGGRDYIDINMGRLSREEAVNIAREMRYLWRYAENIYPNGDKKSRADLKVTLDTFGQYHFYINHMAFKLVMVHLKDIAGPIREGKQVTPGLPDCPAEVPDFLRWDTPSGSTPE